MNTRIHALAIAAAALLAASGAHAQATINQAKISSWPHVLSEPGHYKLIGNIAVPADMPGFVITAPGVTFDLNGFSIAGPVTCTGYGVCSQPVGGQSHGIQIQAEGVSVRNGTVRGFRGIGVVGGPASRLADLTVTQNAWAGVSAMSDAGGPALLERIQSMRNGGVGVTCLRTTLRASEVSMNGGNGIQGNSACTIVDTVVSYNKALGVYANGTVMLRDVRLQQNFGGNKSGAITSAGGNVDGYTPF
jgi:hypothetical protein